MKQTGAYFFVCEDLFHRFRRSIDPKIAFAILTISLLFSTNKTLANDLWSDQVFYRINHEHLAITVPLTQDWRILENQAGRFVAVNSRRASKLTVEVHAVVGQLDKAIGTILERYPHVKVRQLSDDLEGVREFVGEGQKPKITVLGRILPRKECFVLIEVDTPVGMYVETQDELWNIIRNIGESPEVARRLQKGETPYADSEAGYELAYPSNWKITRSEKTLLLFQPHGPSLQVVPDSDSSEKGEQNIARFLNSVAFSVKDFRVESRDSMLLYGRKSPRLTYTYRFPNGEKHKSWVIALTLKTPFLFVCDAPEKEFDRFSTTFISILNSFQITR